MVAACSRIAHGERGHRSGAANHRLAGFARRYDHHRGTQLPPPDPKFGGVIKDDALQSKPWWAPRVVPPKDAPNVLLIMTDDAGFGVPSTFGGVIPTPTMDRDRARRAALHRHVLHRAVLADARCADHRPQPPLGRLRRRLRAVDRLPRLQQHHPQGQGDHRPHPARQRLRARRGSARTTTRRPSPPARSGRSTSGRPAWASSTSTASSAATPTSGSRTCSATRRRSIRSMGKPRHWNLITGMADDAID